MIFVTVGAQTPFDRLVRAVDTWARERGCEEVLAQIGDSPWTPRHVRFVRHLSPTEFNSAIGRARAIVAHAGTGSIFSALRAGKPILVMPRRADLRETRNDHQLATADRLCSRLGVAVAMDELELTARLDALDALVSAPRIGEHACDELIAAVHGFIFDGARAGNGALRARAPDAPGAAGDAPLASR